MVPTASVCPIIKAVTTGHTAQAKAIFLETHAHAFLFRWKQFLTYPWLEEFRSDPDVIPLMDQFLDSRLTNNI
jgi:hypothetical protein